MSGWHFMFAAVLFLRCRFPMIKVTARLALHFTRHTSRRASHMQQPPEIISKKLSPPLKPACAACEAGPTLLSPSTTCRKRRAQVCFTPILQAKLCFIRRTRSSSDGRTTGAAPTLQHLSSFSCHPHLASRRCSSSATCARKLSGACV